MRVYVQLNKCLEESQKWRVNHLDKSKIITAVKGTIPDELARDIVEEFIILRHDVSMQIYGRSSPGKFVETLVQILQYLECEQFESKPQVDKYLRSIEDRPSIIDDGLRICASRIGRSMYSLRNKRNIAHKGDVDPNIYDLQFLYHSAQWILSELIRVLLGSSMEIAGKVIEQIQMPVGGLVEDFNGHRLVLKDITARKEVIIFLHSHYPNSVSIKHIISSLDRRSPKTVRNVLGSLWRDRFIHGDKNTGYMLTRTGFQKAVDIVRDCQLQI